MERKLEISVFGSNNKIELSAKMIIAMLVKPTKAGHTCSYKDAVRFMMLCQARQLNPWEGDAFLVGYDTNNGPEFTIITAHQAFLKRAESNPNYDGLSSGIIIADGDTCRACESKSVLFIGSGVQLCPICNGRGTIDEVEGDLLPDGAKLIGGWCRVFFKNRKVPMYKRIPLAAYNKNRSLWLTNPSGMICKVSEADALRSSFPTLLGGLYALEEGGDRGVTIEAEPVSPPDMEGADAVFDKPKEQAKLAAPSEPIPTAPVKRAAQSGPIGRVVTPEPKQAMPTEQAQKAAVKMPTASQKRPARKPGPPKPADVQEPEDDVPMGDSEAIVSPLEQLLKLMDRDSVNADQVIVWTDEQGLAGDATCIDELPPKVLLQIIMNWSAILPDLQEIIVE